MDTHSSAENRTTVRAYKAPAPVRLGFQFLSTVAPELAARQATRLFLTPQRRAPSGAPRVPGHEARPASVYSRGLALPTWSFGEGERTVLLAHGWNGHAGQLARFVSPLLERGLRVVLFDQPAHGGAEGHEATVLSFAEAVADVARTYRARAVIAHSLGATATALALARHRLELAGAVLYAPAAAVQPYLLRLADALALPASSHEGLFASAGAVLGAPLETLDLRRLAPELRAPALVLHDPEDEEVAFEEGRSVAQSWPGARFVAVRGIGHRGGLRSPLVLSASVDFVSEVLR